MRAWADEEKPAKLLPRHRHQLHAHLHCSHRKRIFSDDEEVKSPPITTPQQRPPPPVPSDAPVRVRVSLSPRGSREKPISKRRKLPDIPTKRRRAFHSPPPARPTESSRPSRQGPSRPDTPPVGTPSRRGSRTEPSGRTIQILELKSRPSEIARIPRPSPPFVRRSSPIQKRIPSPARPRKCSASPSPPRRISPVADSFRGSSSPVEKSPLFAPQTSPLLETPARGTFSPSTPRVHVHSPIDGGSAAPARKPVNNPLSPIDFLVQRRHELAGRGAAELIFPEIGGVGPLAVSVNNVQGRSVGTVMVAFERKSLEILRHRLGVSENDIRERLPRVLHARKVEKTLQPWFLRRELPSEEFALGVEEYKYKRILPYLESLLDAVQEGCKVKDEHSSMDTRHYCTMRELYPQETVRFYLDEQKVQANHPQRYQALNRTFDFITRSLLWCLRTVRPNNAQRRGKTGSTCVANTGPIAEPRDRSIELNADVMNVWLTLLQDWSAGLSQLRESVLPTVKEERTSLSDRVKKEGAESEVAEKGESALHLPSERSFPKVLYLSTDFMTAFEHALVPRFTPELLQASGEARAEGDADAMRSGPITDAASLWRFELWALGSRPHQGFESACERVFRFFRRKRLDPWQWDYVCWPVNYISAHWVLLTMNMKTQELIWSDSYRNCYSQACNESLRTRPPSRGDLKQRRAEASEAVRELFGERMEESEEEGARDESSSESAPLPEPLGPISEVFDIEAIKWNGWLYFWCVEAYMKFDLRRRRNDQLTDAEQAIIAKVWPRACVEGLPQQSKLSLDCGVFVAHFARNIAQFGQTDVVDFGAEDIPHFREAMSVLIGRGGFPQCPQELSSLPEESAEALIGNESEPK